MPWISDEASVNFAAMRFVIITAVLGLAFLFNTGCTKEDQPDGDGSVDITFRMDSGYTW